MTCTHMLMRIFIFNHWVLRLFLSRLFITHLTSEIIPGKRHTARVVYLWHGLFFSSPCRNATSLRQLMVRDLKRLHKLLPNALSQPIREFQRAHLPNSKQNSVTNKWKYIKLLQRQPDVKYITFKAENIEKNNVKEKKTYYNACGK